MYEEQNYQNTYNSTMNNYGAAPNRNPADGSGMEKKSKKKKSHPVLKKGCSLVASGLAFGLAASLVFVGVVKASGIGKTVASISEETTTEEETAQSETSEDTEEQEISNTTIPATNVSQTQTAASISDIVEVCMPSIVSITNTSVEEVMSMFGTRQYEATSAGSGIIVGQNDEELLIATNNHVVSGSEELSVCFDDDENKVVEAKVKGTDANNDLAIVSVKMDDLSDDIKSSISIATLGNSDDLNVGDQVIAIGNALGYGQSVTTGIVSAKDREVTIDNVTAKLIQTDAAINPGNSGGALLNMKGEVIGINSSKFASTQVEGMGYAIPISTAQPILENLMSRQTRDMVDEDEQGYLGISCQNVSEEISEMYNIPQGVYVLSTDKGGAAESAGLMKGDIITAFDGVSILDSTGLKNTLQYYQAGETVELTIQRAGTNGGYQEMQVEVTLGANNSTNNEQQSQQSQGQQSPQENYGNGYGDLDDLFKGLFN
jgi:serine protease Do